MVQQREQRVPLEEGGVLELVDQEVAVPLAEAFVDEGYRLILHHLGNTSGQVAEEGHAIGMFQLLEGAIDLVQGERRKQLTRNGALDHVRREAFLPQALPFMEQSCDGFGDGVQGGDGPRFGLPRMPFAAFEGAQGVRSGRIPLVGEEAELAEVAEDGPFVGDVRRREARPVEQFHALQADGIHLPPETCGLHVEPFHQRDQVLHGPFAQRVEGSDGSFVQQFSAQIQEWFDWLPRTLFVQELKAGAREEVRGPRIASGAIDHGVHRFLPVIVLLGRHPQVLVQPQVAGEGLHHPPGERIDGADGHIAPMVQHVAQDHVGTARKLGRIDARLLLQVFGHIGQRSRIGATFGESFEVADHTFLHLRGRLVGEGERQHVPVGSMVAFAQAMAQVVFHQRMGLTGSGRAMENMEHGRWPS